jgi:nitroimidazol reductase NimA-like FMN-containing flavoprotein (pyridoxamine 5'-phosphate oxidase superfamily)
VPEELDVQGCLEVRAAKHVGRFAYDDGGPVVRPVRHVVHDCAVRCWTSPDGSMGRPGRASLAAFEVDETHDKPRRPGAP